MAWFSMFKNPGILGINARNLLYIRPYNPRKAIKMADNKIKTKHFLSARDIPVPRLYGLIDKKEEVDKFDFNVLPNQFVLKPNFGFGGEGIIPIIDRNKDTGEWVKSSGATITADEYKAHIHDILDGRFSISGIGDTAFFEQLIIADETVGQFAYKGLPDIRIILYNLIPVMAMLRIPTKDSDGKANLHMGAIGVGIDLAKGTATNIIRGNKVINEEYEHFAAIKSIRIPYWDEMLLIASKIQLITNLGYLAVDLALDKTMGPVLLEMNARAGLNVQIANLAPLRKRLEQVNGIKVTSPEKGVRVAKDVFGNIVEKEIEQISGKVIVAEVEEIEILSGQEIIVTQAKIDLNHKETVLDINFAKTHGLITENSEFDEDDPKIKVKLQIQGQKISTIVLLKDLSKKEYLCFIGKRDSGGLLIDPSLTQESKSKGLPNPLEVIARQKIEDKISALHQSINRVNYNEIDEKMYEIEQQIKLLHHLKPINLNEELEKCRYNKNYNPEFYYPELHFNPFELRRALNDIRIDDVSPLAKIFIDKKSEIALKINLLEHIATSRFTDSSIELYGKPDSELLQAVRDEMEKMPKEFDREAESITVEMVVPRFEKVFKRYELKGWKVKVVDKLVSDCIAGKKNTLFIRSGARFGEKRLQTLIAHEIETHIISAENGKRQPYKIFNRGTANYLITQEGLAVYNQNRYLSDKDEKWYWSMSNVIATDIALNGSFADVVAGMMDLGFTHERALRIAVKCKRGLENTALPGAFTKDIVYYKGYLEVKDFIEKGGKIKDLYYGKININDLEVVKKIPGIKKPHLLPTFLK